MIIRGGRNFYPYDLERAIGELAGVRRGCVAVFGAGGAGPGGEAGERVVVVAETRERDPLTRTALERCIVALAVDELGLPPDVVVLAPPHAVLKTSSGKIRRAAIREAWQQGTLGASARAPWLQLLRLAAASLPGQLRNLLPALAWQLYAVWSWGWFGLLAPVAALAILTLPTLGQRWAVIRALARLYTRLTGCRLQVDGLEQLPPDPCVLVANHASYIDGVVLVAALPQPVRFIAKIELSRNPLLGRLFARMDARFVERFDSRQGVEDVGALTAVAGEMPPLMFFAEGTFVAPPGLRPFRLGAFRIAAELGLPVVPVALAGTRHVLPAGRWRPRRGSLKVTVCPPLAPAGDGWEHALALRDLSRDAILAHCGEPDAAPAAPPSEAGPSP
jgi:1-acyl-sn-glycerol-3-phosphate acyltransferase